MTRTEPAQTEPAQGSASLAPDLTLNHVAIAAPDPRASMAFYAAFGFQPGFCRTDAAGRIQLQQMRRAAVFIELIADIRPPSDRHGTPGHFGLHTAALPDLLAHLAAQGLKPLHPPRQGASGVSWTFFRDPAGNLVEVTAPIPA